MALPSRIFIVEDEAVVAMDIKQSLLALGYELAGWVTTGEKALVELREGGADLVLMDIRLKGDWDGIETAERIVEELELPIIFLTAHTDERTLARAKASAPMGYLKKPFDERELRASIEVALRKHALWKVEHRHSAYVKSLFAALPIPLLVLDPDSMKIDMVNDALLNLFLKDRKEIQGRSLEEFLQEEEGDERFEDVLKSAISLEESSGQSRFNKLDLSCLRRADGARLNLAVTARKVEFEGSKKGLLLLEDKTELLGLRKVLGLESAFQGMLGKDPSMKAVFKSIREVASVRLPVLLQGESGTGKELVARAIHFLESDRERPFIAINCAAIPADLLESELFGYKKGAFTGALSDKKGYFARADGGSIFLDEVGELPLALQAKLLRVLQEHSFLPLGSEDECSVDLRVISASKRNLEKAMSRGSFREDLYYRLCVIPIHLPPLRERGGDIPLLANYFVKSEAKRLDLHEPRLSEEALSLLQDYSWPGNVRELKNVMQFALVKTSGGRIGRENLPEKVRAKRIVHRAPPEEQGAKKLDGPSVRAALRAADGNKSKAAQALSVSRSTLYRFLRENPGLTTVS